MSCSHSGANSKALLQSKKINFVIALNLAITLAQAVGGFISGSLALLSDALHNLSDVLALIISAVAMRFKLRHGNLQETYGRRRAEIIAAIVNTLMLVGIAFVIIKEAVLRLLHPSSIDPYPVIVLGLASILINAISAAILYRDSKESLNLKSAYLHLFSDMLTSIAVVIGAVVVKFWHILWVDAALSLLIAIYLIYASWGTLMNSLHVIMHFVPKNIDLKAVEKEILQHPEIDNIHHVHIWSLDGQAIHFEAHVDFQKDLVLSQVCIVNEQIAKILASSFGITHAILQPEVGISHSKQLINKDCRN